MKDTSTLDLFAEKQPQSACPHRCNSLIGVPITALDKLDTTPDGDWEIVDLLKPMLNGCAKYDRIIIRRRPPRPKRVMFGGKLK